MSDVHWVNIFGTFVGGLASLGWIIYPFITFLRRPRLIFSKGPYIGKWGRLPVDRRYVNFDICVANIGTARRCGAKATITYCVLKYPETDTDKYEPLEVYSLHWADVVYEPGVTAMRPVDIMASPQRLDVVFTDENEEKKGKKGAYMAVTGALGDPGGIRQAYLPPGTYQIEVIVYCDNGRRICKTITIESPEKFTDLQCNA